MGIGLAILHLQDKLQRYEAYCARILVAARSYDEHKYLIAGWSVFQKAINRLRARLTRLRGRASIEALVLDIALVVPLETRLLLAA